MTRKDVTQLLKLRWIVALLIASVWAFGAVAPAFRDDYKPSLAADGPMLALVAWLFHQQKKDEDDAGAK